MIITETSDYNDILVKNLLEGWEDENCGSISNAEPPEKYIYGIELDKKNA